MNRSMRRWLVRRRRVWSARDGSISIVPSHSVGVKAPSLRYTRPHFRPTAFRVLGFPALSRHSELEHRSLIAFWFKLFDLFRVFPCKVPVFVILYPGGCAAPLYAGPAVLLPAATTATFPTFAIFL